MTPRPLFIVGNKRSGSTLLVNMLNEHPAVGVTHESDVVWILFQCRQGRPAQFQCFPLDGPRGMEAVLEACGEALQRMPADRPADVAKEFYDIQRRVLEQGTSVHVPLKSAADLQWIGDKKPVQHAWPEMNEFIWREFPAARMIHIVRHPAGVVASKTEAARTWPVTPPYWHGSSAEVLEHWARHEQWVLDAKQTHPDAVYSLRLEDLCHRPAEEMMRAFAFLELESPAALGERLALYAYQEPNARHAAFEMPSYSAAARAIMEYYGYDDDIAKSPRLPARDPRPSRGRPPG